MDKFTIEVYTAIVQLMCDINALDETQSKALSQKLMFDMSRQNYSGSCDDMMVYAPLRQFIDRHARMVG